MQNRYFTHNPKQTKELGKSLAKDFLKNRHRTKALVVGLAGDLGGGKTTFLQGFAKGLGKKGRILSPTFIIMRRTDNFYHIDCYRLGRPEELSALGFKKIVKDPANVVAVEWADMVKKIMPRHTIWADFKFIDKNQREIVIRSINGSKKQTGHH